MDTPETLEKLDTQDTGRIPINFRHNTENYEYKQHQHGTHQNPHIQLFNLFLILCI